MILRYQKKHTEAMPPERVHGDPHSDAGWDLRCPSAFVIPARETVAVDIGIAIELPSDETDFIWEGQIRPRSSLRKKGVVASLGTIDSGYRGEIGCILHNLTDHPVEFCKHDKICQLVIVRLPKIDTWEEVQELNITSRNEKRYGSSGR
jgi:dUTP pyrophosphatase